MTENKNLLLATQLSVFRCSNCGNMSLELDRNKTTVYEDDVSR